MIEKLETLMVPGPTITAVTKPFWDGIASGKFLLQKCNDCGKWVFYPRTHCSHCWSIHLQWQQGSGRGKLTTWSIVERPGHPAWQPATPYVLGIVELEEGPTMLTHLLIDSQDDLKIGLPLQMRPIEINGIWLPFFKPLSTKSDEEGY